MSELPATAWIGLGAMGEPMAGHLAAAGALCAVHNRSPEKASQVAGRLAVAAVADPGALPAHAEVLFLCVSADADVLSVVDALRPGLRAGQVVVDCSTVAPATARTAAAMLAPLGVDFLDAPLSGGVEGARAGRLSVMVGGEQTVLARVRPLLECFAARITHMGPVGAGQATKAVNQVLVAGIAEGVCEGLALGRALGLPTDRLLAVLTAGAANAWFLEKRGASMLQGHFEGGFQAQLLLKDLKIVSALAAEAGLDLPALRQGLNDYAALVAAGHGGEEISGLIRLKARRSEGG